MLRCRESSKPGRDGVGHSEAEVSDGCLGNTSKLKVGVTVLHSLLNSLLDCQESVEKNSKAERSNS